MTTKTLIEVVKTSTTPVFVSFNNVSKLLGLSANQIRQVVEDDPTFPKMRRLAPGVSAYGYDDIMSWATATREATNG